MTESLEYLRSLRRRMDAGDDLGLTLPERDALTLRISAAEAAHAERESAAFSRATNPFRRDGTTDTSTPTTTLAGLGYGDHNVKLEFRSTLESLDNHLDRALDASSLSHAQRHVKRAKAALDYLKRLAD